MELNYNQASFVERTNEITKKQRWQYNIKLYLFIYFCFVLEYALIKSYIVDLTLMICCSVSLSNDFCVFPVSAFMKEALKCMWIFKKRLHIIILYVRKQGNNNQIHDIKKGCLINAFSSASQCYYSHQPFSYTFLGSYR